MTYVVGPGGNAGGGADVGPASEGFLGGVCDGGPFAVEGVCYVGFVVAGAVCLYDG